MKKAVYICVLSIIFTIGLGGCNSKDAEKIVLFGSEQQKKELHTPLVEDKFDFSELGYKKKFRIFPKYYGNYAVEVNAFNHNNDVWEKLPEYTKYFFNCLKMRVYVDDKIIKETFSNELSYFNSLTHYGFNLFYFTIKEEYLNKKIFVEVELINTNDWLKNKIGEKVIIIKAKANM